MPMTRFVVALAIVGLALASASRAQEVDWNAALSRTEESLAAAPDEAARFEILGLAAGEARSAGQFTKAVAYGLEFLSLAESHRDSWAYGNALHEGHQLLGLLALSDGDTARATKELLLSAVTPGSPQLRTFGPRMDLAKKLLEAGRKDEVLEYLHRCRTFWKMDYGRLDAWTAEIEKGEVPDFVPNVDL